MKVPRLSWLLALVLAIAALDTACKPDVITQSKTDTLIVQRPGRTDTIVVTRPDTVIITHAETSVVQLPGRVDTVVRRDTLVIPPRVDTLYLPRVDTMILTRPETTVVVRPETLLVVQHDTVIVHDTVTHYDTVRLSQMPAFVCLTLPKADTIFALSGDVTPYCDATHLAAQFPGKVMVNAPGATIVMTLPTPSASAYRGTLLLPGYLSRHGASR